MENDLITLLKYNSMNLMNQKMYLEYVDIFVDNSINKAATLKELRKKLNAYQTFGETESIDYVERLCVQLLGHQEVTISLLIQL